MAQILIYNQQNKCLLFSAFVLGDKMQGLGFGVFFNHQTVCTNPLTVVGQHNIRCLEGTFPGRTNGCHFRNFITLKIPGGTKGIHRFDTVPERINTL